MLPVSFTTCTAAFKMSGPILHLLLLSIISDSLFRWSPSLISLSTTSWTMAFNMLGFPYTAYMQCKVIASKFHVQWHFTETCKRKLQPTCTALQLAKIITTVFHILKFLTAFFVSMVVSEEESKRTVISSWFGVNGFCFFSFFTPLFFTTLKPSDSSSTRLHQWNWPWQVVSIREKLSRYCLNQWLLGG